MSTWPPASAVCLTWWCFAVYLLPYIFIFITCALWSSTVILMCTLWINCDVTSNKNPIVMSPDTLPSSILRPLPLCLALHVLLHWLLFLKCLPQHASYFLLYCSVSWRAVAFLNFFSGHAYRCFCHWCTLATFDNVEVKYRATSTSC